MEHQVQAQDWTGTPRQGLWDSLKPEITDPFSESVSMLDCLSGLLEALEQNWTQMFLELNLGSLNTPPLVLDIPPSLGKVFIHT
jgi:hypothetical protein